MGTARLVFTALCMAFGLALFARAGTITLVYNETVYGTNKSFQYYGGFYNGNPSVPLTLTAPTLPGYVVNGLGSLSWQVVNGCVSVGAGWPCDGADGDTAAGALFTSYSSTPLYRGELEVDLASGCCYEIGYGASGSITALGPLIGPVELGVIDDDYSDNSGSYGVQLTAAWNDTPLPAPEPATLALVAAGLLGLGLPLRFRLRSRH